MLVLSRKVDQQIKIGDDITLTVVRVEGNRVRIGVSAPRDVRILRGELATELSDNEPIEFELSEREFAFAHQNAADKIASKKNRQPRITENQVSQQQVSEQQVFVGTVSADGSKVKLTDAASKPAPLSGFVSAT